MAEDIVADMDFLGFKKEKEKEFEFMKNGSNPKRIWARTKDKAKINAIADASADDTNSNNRGNKSDHRRITIKINDVRSVGYLDPWSNYFREKGRPSAELKLGMAFQEKLNEKNSSYSSSKSVGRAKLAVSGFIPLCLDLSVDGSDTNPIDLFPNQTGFGSPIEIMGEFDHKTSSEQEDFLELATSFRTPQERESGAQLTIFCGGTVNVYNDILADKAENIMLIASSGNHSSYPHAKVQNGCEPQSEQKISLPVLQSSEESGIHRKLADLPLKRRHSLQRFLEKRKERIYKIAKCPYTTTEAIISDPPQHSSSSSSPMSVHSNSHS